MPRRPARRSPRCSTTSSRTRTERRWIEPALLALLGVGEAPPGGRDELFRAWRTFFERIAATGIVALVFEDLHWADAGLLDFIDHLLEWSRGVPILIITLARPDLLERRPDWGAGRRNFLALGLEPLDDDAMRELLAGLVPGLPAATVALDHRPSRRHPAVRGRDGPDARRRRAAARGGWHATSRSASSASWPCPRRCRRSSRPASMASTPADRALLQDAAVLGQSFTLAALAAVNGGTEEATVGARLHDLAGHGARRASSIDPRSPERGHVHCSSRR